MPFPRRLTILRALDLHIIFLLPIEKATLSVAIFLEHSSECGAGLTEDDEEDDPAGLVPTPPGQIVAV